jgi:hydroxymethylglutaryl-CoA reductase (NADPH)
MPAIPSFVLKKLYVKGSLRAQEEGFALDVRNTIAPGTLLGVTDLTLDGTAVPLANVRVVPGVGAARPASSISAEESLSFPLGATFSLVVTGQPLAPGKHELQIGVVVKDVGPIEIPVVDELA